MRSSLVDIELIYQFQTDKAVCVREDETSTKDIWIPLSQCEVDGIMERGKVVTLTAEQWLLQNKGLV